MAAKAYLRHPFVAQVVCVLAIVDATNKGGYLASLKEKGAALS